MTAICAVELVRVELEMVEPFRTAHGTVSARPVVLVRVLSSHGEGWGECSALPEPTYTGEWVDGAYAVLRDHLVPRLLRGHPHTDVRGHPMATAALRTAMLDAQLRSEGRSLAASLGAMRATVPAGVAIGRCASIEELCTAVQARIDEGYRRVKLKIMPGWDVAPAQAVNREFNGVELTVDANGSYRLDDGEHLKALDALDELGVAAIEQPFGADRLLDHVSLTARLRTDVALDETISSAAAGIDAIRLGACRAISVKAARMGGLDEAVTLLQHCSATGVRAWIGGMLETGIGRASAVALSACPGVTSAGDVSASDRYYREDVIAEPFVLRDGSLAVPDGPGLGVEVSFGHLRVAPRRELIKP